jgi:hypothetical protein
MQPDNIFSDVHDLKLSAHRQPCSPQLTAEPRDLTAQLGNLSTLDSVPRVHSSDHSRLTVKRGRGRRAQLGDLHLTVTLTVRSAYIV